MTRSAAVSSRPAAARPHNTKRFGISTRCGWCFAHSRAPHNENCWLVTLRFVQGLGVGGEWGGAVLMAVEHGAAGKRGLYASWVQAGVKGSVLEIGCKLYSVCVLPPTAPRC